MSKLPTQHFVIDLSGIELSDIDGELKTWIQGLPLGTWQHPVHGKIEITPQRVANFVRNFHDRVRETDLDIDYEHKEFTSKAAGWILDVEDRGQDGLWLFVEWTPSARRALKDKEYRYFSPEFADKWQHPKTKKEFKDVLFGGAITNRPFLKDILPINMSEFGHQPDQGDSNMDELLKQLATLLGVQLSDEDNNESATAKLSDSIKALQDSKKPGESAGDPELKKLAESNPALAKLLADKEEQDKRLQALEAAQRLSEVAVRLSEVNTAKLALPPAFVDKIKPALAALPTKLAEGIYDGLKLLTEKGLVQLGEGATGAHQEREPSGDLVKQFHDEVEKLTSGEKALSYIEAVSKVSAEKPELFDAYNNFQLSEVK